MDIRYEKYDCLWVDCKLEWKSPEYVFWKGFTFRHGTFMSLSIVLWLPSRLKADV